MESDCKHLITFTSFTDHGFVSGQLIRENCLKYQQLSIFYSIFGMESQEVILQQCALSQERVLVTCVCVLHAVLRVCQETCWSGVCLKTWTWMEWSSKPSPVAPIESPRTSCKCAHWPQRELMCFVHTGHRAGGFKDTLGLNRHHDLKTRRKWMTPLSF